MKKQAQFRGRIPGGAAKLINNKSKVAAIISHNRYSVQQKLKLQLVWPELRVRPAS